MYTSHSAEGLAPIMFILLQILSSSKVNTSPEFEQTSFSRFFMSSASISTSRKRRREVRWDEVVEELEGITIDKQGLVRDLSEYALNAGMFVYQFSPTTEEVVCQELWH